jgi:hypothetical protein
MSKRKKEGEEEVNTYVHLGAQLSLYPCSALFKGRSCLRLIVKRKVIVCEWIILYFIIAVWFSGLLVMSTELPNDSCSL